MSITPGASTSSSSIPKSFKYDVFISFRGEDTRKNFVGHLYEALQAKCIETYKDDETIEQGERINDQLLKSIEDSKFYIIVFSKTYASSSWCLDELVKIMECQKMTEHAAFPVFYDVEPTEVRKQSGAIKEAFAEHEEKEAAGKWRDAMKELPYLSGWELKATANEDESKLIQIIVEAIFEKLHSTNSSADGKLVGMETRFSNILSSLKIGTEDVRMIGIWGMGGGGKTTLARAVYDQISTMFEGKSFVENVREVSQPSQSGLKDLQKRILEDVLNKKDITFSSVHDGKNMLKAMMCRRKILLVLDDVDRIEQLEALAGEPDWFKSGSRIIITTRDDQVLRAHIVDFVHNVDLLTVREAICLFSRHAFQKEIPIRGYEELSRQVVQYTVGLPLTIRVLGSFLCGKDKLEWVEAIERLKKIPLKKTREKLELSYISLEDDCKEIFLDIACILKGERRECAIKVLECYGFHARNGIEVLEQRSLITISTDGRLDMHDHIEEMGKYIVRRSQPDEPNKHRRLWISKETEDVLANDKHNSNKRLCFSDPSFITLGESTSSSSIQKRFKYDVFISFRGEDTRKTFVDHLYHALKDKGIYTYKDDEKIEQGKTIDNQLIQAIKDSRFFIIVFSQNYASSSWCLDELVEILECQKTGEQIAYPVFFDVEPTHVRYQSGAFGNAFLENRNKDAAGKWIDALKGAAGLAGWELKNTLDGHEAKFIKKIVQEISLELRSITFGFDENLVGMETRVRDVVKSLEVGTDEVRMIGIKGMGGAGKTTTARAVFDHLSADFEAISFVENVREVSNGSVSGLKNLQEQVLSDVLNEHVAVNGVSDGIKMMRKRMCCKKVLLVLDDVDHIKQLKALAVEPKWFKPGSRILITTRDEQVLVAHRVNVICDIVLLSEDEAISLFSRYAFGRENPLPGYEELSGKVVRYAAGLPLTVQVLGSFLCGKDKDEWEDAIDRLKNIPLKETLEKLELSYISLEDDYKEIFLDIACILKGKRKTDAITILESCDFHARNGLKVLEQRSLITISKHYEVLGMHDHIEEMGKNIVRRSHPEEPNKLSRLWNSEEIKDILANDRGTEATRCLRLNMWRGNSRILMEGLGKMKKLRYLQVNFAIYANWESDGECLGIDPKFDDISPYFTNSLKYLECANYPFLYLPKTFEANNLVGLDMSSSTMVQLWEQGEEKVLKKLKFMSLSNSKLTTFDFRITPNLETLSLNYSFNLKQLCMPVSCQKLNYLYISHSKLRTFDLGWTPNLERLYLIDCADFVELHVQVACPNLKFLYLPRSRLRNLDLEMIPNLERLDLAGCDELVEINVPIGGLKKLVHKSSSAKHIWVERSNYRCTSRASRVV